MTLEHQFFSPCITTSLTDKPIHNALVKFMETYFHFHLYGNTHWNIFFTVYSYTWYSCYVLPVINNFLLGTKFDGVCTEDAKWNNATGMWNIWRVSTYWEPISAWRLHIIVRTWSRSEHHWQAVFLRKLSALWANKGEVSQFCKSCVSPSHTINCDRSRI